MIHNREVLVPRATIERGAVVEAVERALGPGALRWCISKADDRDLHVEATIWDDRPAADHADVTTQVFPGRSVVVSVVPTGIGCSIGGYAGDACPASALLAASADYLVTHPNALNASNFISTPPNLLYTEGYTLDLFMRGAVNLYRPYRNKIGLVVEKVGRAELDVVFNVINTVRAVHGVDIEHVVITDEKIGGRCLRTPSGAYVGTVERPRVLFDACETLISRGVDAIAITSNIEGLPTDDYALHFRGEHPNPVGGVEAILSHIVSSRYGIPAAHGPMINFKNFSLERPVVDARGAGEISSVSGLACVLVGLRAAPQFASARTRCADAINLNNVVAVVAPASALGGVPMLCAEQRGIPIIAVRDNRTILDVTAARLGLSNVIEASSYAEAAGLVLALTRGISLASIRRPLSSVTYT
ncbi:MAG: DUF3326 domain-containing protein [Pseudomonadota bacterium]